MLNSKYRISTLLYKRISNFIDEIPDYIILDIAEDCGINRDTIKKILNLKPILKLYKEQIIDADDPYGLNVDKDLPEPYNYFTFWSKREIDKAASVIEDLLDLISSIDKNQLKLFESKFKQLEGKHFFPYLLSEIDSIKHLFNSVYASEHLPEDFFSRGYKGSGLVLNIRRNFELFEWHVFFLLQEISAVDLKKLGSLTESGFSLFKDFKRVIGLCENHYREYYDLLIFRIRNTQNSKPGFYPSFIKRIIPVIDSLIESLNSLLEKLPQIEKLTEKILPDGRLKPSKLKRIESVTIILIRSLEEYKQEISKNES